MQGMNYSEGIAYIKKLIDDNRSGTFIPRKNLIVNYPGRKNRYDYRLEIRGWEEPPRHDDVCKMLCLEIVSGRYAYENILALLNHTYKHGTEVPFSAFGTRLESFQHLIFWITLQEEINYPRARGFAGIKMPFCRYFEAIYCTQTKDFTLADVLERCKNRGRGVPELYLIDNAPEFYR